MGVKGKKVATIYAQNKNVDHHRPLTSSMDDGSDGVDEKHLMMEVKTKQSEAKTREEMKKNE